MHYQRWKAHGDPHVERYRPGETCGWDGCERPHVARGLCSWHYQIETGRATSPYPKVRRHIPALRARDGDVCGICGGPLDLLAVWPDGGSVTVDHVVPVVCGGGDGLDNLQLAHSRCNIRKGSRR